MECAYYFDFCRLCLKKDQPNPQGIDCRRVDSHLLFQFAADWRGRQGKDNDFFPGYGANVVVQTDWPDAGDIANDLF